MHTYELIERERKAQEERKQLGVSPVTPGELIKK